MEQPAAPTAGRALPVPRPLEFRVIRYTLPSIDDLLRLGEPRLDAMSVYLPTEPTPAGRNAALTAVKSAVDEAIQTLRDKGRPRSVEDGLRAEWVALTEDTGLWGNLGRSLAVFLSPGFSEEYVVANAFDERRSFGKHFDLAPLVRAVTTPQDAFALTLSSNGWNLWRATAAARIAELELVGDYADDAADATNRMSIRGRKLLRRLGGDEGQKVLLERYAQVVADAVRSELGRLDPSAGLPLFVFANDPLGSLIQNQDLPWQIELVRGAPDELRPDELDEAVRERIGALNSAEASRRADEIGDGFARGLASIDTAQVARAAVAGAVGTLFYAVDADAKGSLDHGTGEIRFEPDGDDLLTQIALAVLRNGGEVRAVRPNEITAEIWNGRLLAGLRHPLA
ncbi:MAG: hypothetical protein QM779_14665 [Propionicimonas sp.]|uniref:baeRF11 domain-containing protein n=1 Tax=Propionicimonas sp. TaxID=1955623 RepID=UPI003D0EEF0A